MHTTQVVDQQLWGKPSRRIRPTRGAWTAGTLLIGQVFSLEKAPHRQNSVRLQPVLQYSTESHHVQQFSSALVHIVWPRDPFGDISATDPGSSNNRRKLNYPCVVAAFANALSGKYGLSAYSNKITVMTFIKAAKA